jgi:drug/metabolite transporter (DMT)-like permease
VTVTGWESFEITDVVCAAAALIAAVRGAVAVFGDDDDPAIPGSVLTLAFGAAALALVLYRIVNPPGIGEEREIGVWVGAFAAGGIVYGSYIAMRSGPPSRDRPPV